MRTRALSAFLLTAWVFFTSGCGSAGKLPEATTISSARQSIELPKGEKMVLGTYAGLPRLENGRADLPKLMEQLKDLNANTYNFLIWQGDKDWDDLQL